MSCFVFIILHFFNFLSVHFRLGRVRNNVESAVHGWVLAARVGSLDELIKDRKTSQSTGPPQFTLAGRNVLAIEIESQLWRHTIIKQNVVALHQLNVVSKEEERQKKYNTELVLFLFLFFSKL